MGNLLNILRSISNQEASSSMLYQSSDKQRWLNDIRDLSPASPLRVLIVLSQRPSETGSGIYLREIVAELQKLGHQPYILAANYKPLTETDFPSVQANNIFTLIFGDGTNSEISEIKFPIPGMSLDMPYQHRPFHSLSDDMLEQYCMVWAQRISNIAETIKPHIIHVNHLWLLPGITRIAASWLPVVATYHGSEFKLLKKSPEFAPLVLPGIRYLNTIMPVSNDSAQEAQKFFGVLPEQTKVIGNGYNPSLFKVRPRSSGLTTLKELLKPSLAQPEWRKLVLYVGKFADYKGLPYLIRAAKIYNTADDGILTVIVGDGSHQVREKLNNLIKQLELTQKVVMPGKVAYNVVSSLMNTADVFVLPSVNEPFGLVFLEALACGIRGVSADRGGPPFFVPKTLLEKKLVSLINPLELLANQSPNPSDEERYLHDLADAIQFQLSSTTSSNDRHFIAQSVQDQTWTSRAMEVLHVYFDAIQRHSSAVTSRSAQ